MRAWETTEERNGIHHRDTEDTENGQQQTAKRPSVGARHAVPAARSLTRNPLVHSFELAGRVNQRVTFVGWLVMMRHAVTRKREYMKFLCLEDRHGMVEVVVFPDTYRRLGDKMAAWGAYRVEGIVKEQHGAVSLVAEQVEILPEPRV